MDVRGRVGSQSGLPSIKRPWEEERTIGSEKRNEWHGALLPPIDSAPHHRPQQPRGGGMNASGLHSYHNQYTREFAEPEAKRPRYELNNEYQTLPGDSMRSNMNGHRVHLQPGRKSYPSPYSSMYMDD
jgi:hypothetical protein